MEAELINQLNNTLNDLEKRSEDIRVYMDYQGKKDRLEEVIGLSEDPELWNDPKRAQEIGKERKILEGIVVTLDNIASGIEDNRMLIEMAVEENDEEGFAAVQEDVAGLEKQMADLEFKRMFNQPADPNNCFIDITAGAGGTEAEDSVVTPSAKVSKSKSLKKTTAKSRASTAPPSAWKANTPTACCAPKPAFTAWCATRRLTRTTNAIHRSRLCLFTLKSTIPSKSKSTRPICVSTLTAHPVPVVSTLTKPTPPCALPTSRRELWCSVKTTVRNTPTKPPRWKC